MTWVRIKEQKQARVSNTVKQIFYSDKAICVLWKRHRYDVTIFFRAEYFMVPAAVFHKDSNLPGFDQIFINICNLPENI